MREPLVSTPFQLKPLSASLSTWYEYPQSNILSRSLRRARDSSDANAAQLAVAAASDATPTGGLHRLLEDLPEPQ